MVLVGNLVRNNDMSVTPSPSTVREGAMTPAERRAYWRRLDAEIEERQRAAREERAQRSSSDSP
jgi:hypothetical protein